MRDDGLSVTSIKYLFAAARMANTLIHNKVKVHHGHCKSNKYIVKIVSVNISMWLCRFTLLHIMTSLGLVTFAT